MGLSQNRLYRDPRASTSRGVVDATGSLIGGVSMDIDGGLSRSLPLSVLTHDANAARLL